MHVTVKKQFYGKKHSFIEWTYVAGAHRGNSNVHQQHMLRKLRKPILKYTLNKYQVHWLSSFKVSNCQSVLKYLSLCGKLFIFSSNLIS